jgi:sigma-B regulation protein RsbU (phosphoserine phosphatase)
MLEAIVPRRPHALLVGQLPVIAGWNDPENDLELRRISAEGAPEAIRQAAADVVVLDGGLADRELEPVLSAVEDLEETVRPSLVVVTVSERRSPFDRRNGWRRPPHAVVDGRRGRQEVIAGIQGAVQARRLAAELVRRDAEVRELQRRLEVLSGQMAEELRLASRVQRSLLPAACEHPRLDVAREFIPFREIGGDYYDFLPLGPQRMAFAIGDVMGKGIAAALLASSLKAAVRAQLQGAAAPSAPEEVVARVNRLFGEVAPRGLFASLFFVNFDLETLEMAYVNAGHDYPFVVRAGGEVVELREGGTLLGLEDHSAYERGTVRLDRDDLVVFYSDGVTDRGDAEGEPYGVERLKEAARRSRADAARIVLYSMLGDVQGWSGGTSAHDDATLVVFKAR